MLDLLEGHHGRCVCGCVEQCSKMFGVELQYIIMVSVGFQLSTVQLWRYCCNDCGDLYSVYFSKALIEAVCMGRLYEMWMTYSWFLPFLIGFVCVCFEVFLKWLDTCTKVLRSVETWCSVQHVCVCVRARVHLWEWVRCSVAEHNNRCLFTFSKSQQLTSSVLTSLSH